VKRCLPEATIISLVAKATGEAPENLRVFGRPDELYGPAREHPGSGHPYLNGVPENCVLVLDTPSPTEVYYLCGDGSITSRNADDLARANWLAQQEG